MSFTTMTIGDLCVSPYNCRTNEADANAVAGMAESLLNRGQLYPLVVHPMPGTKGKKRKYGALAGGRRFRAFTLLVTEGKLPADHPIDVIVRDITDEGELRELSLAENLVRRDLRPYEVYAAVARAHAKGRSLKEIAETNGQTIATVRGWARLGALHPTIFAALEAGSISQDEAKAFGATEHQDLQLKIFEQLQRSGGATSAAGIRRLLKVGDSELATMLRFVGEEAYAKEGGRYELDLFADQADQRGRIEDEGLLIKLVEAKLERNRALLRRQVQNHTPGRDLRFEARPPRDGEFGGIARDLEISVEPADIDPQDVDRAEVVHQEMTRLEKLATDLLADPDIDQATKDAGIADIDVDYEPLETELAAIDERRALALPEGEIFATLEIEQDGSLEQRFWWATRKAKRVAARPAIPAPVSTGPIAKRAAAAAMSALMPKPAAGGSALDNSYGYAERQKADAAIKDQFGLTSDGVQVMRCLRREVLRCALLDDAEADGVYGRDYAIWALLRYELAGGYGFEVGARRLASGYESSIEYSEGVQSHVKRSLAGMRWHRETSDLRAHESMSGTDLVSAFRAFHAASEEWKNKAAAYLAGLVLERSLIAPGYQIPVHDLLAERVNLREADIRAYAEPTEELVDLLPKAHRLALAEPHVDKMAFGTWGKLKAGELTAPVTRALHKAKNWVHPLMRFDRPPGRSPEAREAAE
ncbi:ParB/RepB/Spo0J family partition protein [Sphingobium lactosutens]|uniref:ParB/RepB/Spo0J family partition protein n=1 Tax=Sphingobium lactosutens TaxID=522773 RepID=UPI0015C01CD2|nr:ParB/RepB/Spo0J family partition protein [Sphingobium lactosutens]